jgi:hypothetical protein
MSMRVTLLFLSALWIGPSIAGAGGPERQGPTWAEVSRRSVQTHLRLRNTPELRADNIVARLLPGTRVWILEAGSTDGTFVRVATPLGVGWVAAHPYLDLLGPAPSPYETVEARNGISLLGVAGSGEFSALPASALPNPGQPVREPPQDDLLLDGNPMGETNSAIGSPFGLRPWIGGIGSRYHQGVDLTAQYPKPIYALGPGAAERVGYGLHSGRTLTTRHGPFLVRYLHLSATSVRQRTLQRGMLLGTTGNSGYDRRGHAYKPHLHFELWQNCRPIDPVQYRAIGRTLRYVPAKTARWSRYGWPFTADGR